MAMRRMPGGFGSGPTVGMAGGMMPGAGAGGPGGPGGPMQPRPPMTGAPAGNANPQAQNGSPMQPPAVPPPIEPTAGGPTSPFNIQSMLQTNRGNAGGMSAGPMGPQQPTRRAPLTPWGDSQGKPAGTMSNTGDDLGHPADQNGPGMNAMQQGTDATDPSKSPLVMLRLMKALGKI